MMGRCQVDALEPRLRLRLESTLQILLDQGVLGCRDCVKRARVAQVFHLDGGSLRLVDIAEQVPSIPVRQRFAIHVAFNADETQF